jgi:sec-independent protein translocase protein TatA
MGGLSPIHWLLVIAVAGIVFGGRGKLSSIMGDAAKGIRAFKDGLKDEEHPATPVQPTQIASAPPPAQPGVAEREEVRR